MKVILFFFVLMIVLGQGKGLEAGEIYQWIDKDGVLNFTDGPPPPGAQMVEGLSETPSDEPRAPTGPVDTGGTGPADSDEFDATADDAVEAGPGDGFGASQDGPTGAAEGDEFGAAEDGIFGGVENNGFGTMGDGESDPAANEESGATEEGQPGAVAGDETEGAEGAEGRWRGW